MNRYRQALLFLTGLIITGIGLAWYLFVTPIGVPILMYHKISYDNNIYSIRPDLFDNQMQYLAGNGFTAISLAQLADGLTGKSTLPAKPIVITFDDGYEDNFTTALPILEKYGLRGAVFIAVDKVGQPGYLSWDQIQVMQNRRTDIGSHTLSHTALTTLDSAQWEQEVKNSKLELEQRLQKPATFLAYPHGKFSSDMFGYLKQVGYTGAFSGITGLNSQGTSLYALNRISVLGPKLGVWDFRIQLAKANIASLLKKI